MFICFLSLEKAALRCPYPTVPKSLTVKTALEAGTYLFQMVRGLLLMGRFLVILGGSGRTTREADIVTAQQQPQPHQQNNQNYCWVETK